MKKQEYDEKTEQTRATATEEESKEGTREQRERSGVTRRNVSNRLGEEEEK